MENLMKSLIYLVIKDISKIVYLLFLKDNKPDRKNGFQIGPL